MSPLKVDTVLPNFHTLIGNKINISLKMVGNTTLGPIPKKVWRGHKQFHLKPKLLDRTSSNIIFSKLIKLLEEEE